VEDGYPCDSGILKVTTRVWGPINTREARGDH
jgi:hypothetical protein